MEKAELFHILANSIIVVLGCLFFYAFIATIVFAIREIIEVFSKKT